MNDTCKNCTVRGDMDVCLETPCNTRDSWYAQQLQSENEALREALGEIEALDYRGSATNLAATVANRIARQALAAHDKEGK